MLFDFLRGTVQKFCQTTRRLLSTHHVKSFDTVRTNPGKLLISQLDIKQILSFVEKRKQKAKPYTLDIGHQNLLYKLEEAELEGACCRLKINNTKNLCAMNGLGSYGISPLSTTARLL